MFQYLLILLADVEVQHTPDTVYFLLFFKFIGTIVASLPAIAVPFYTECTGISGHRLSIRGYLAFVKSMSISQKDACDFIADVTISSSKNNRMVFRYTLWLLVFMAGSFKLIVIGLFMITLCVSVFTYRRGKQWREKRFSTELDNQ